MSAFTVSPVGFVRGRPDAADAGWGDVVSTIVLDPARFDASALRGLEDFSHVEVVFLFHEVPAARVCYGARHPRDDPRWPLLGIFAQHGSARPNRIGVSRVQLVTVRATELDVRGLDAIDGTPVLDIKPWFREFGPRGEVRQPEWVGEVMEGYFE